MVLHDMAPPPMRVGILTRLAALGAMSNDELASLTAVLSPRERLTVDAAEPTPAAKLRAWDRALDPHVTPEDRRAIAAGFFQPGQEPLLADYAEAFFDQMLGSETPLGLDASKWYPRLTITEEAAQRAEELTRSASVPAAHRRVLAAGANEVRRALRIRANATRGEVDERDQ